MFTKGIWKRTGADEMTRNGYVRAVAMFTLVVSLLVVAGAKISFDWLFSWPLLIATFIGSIVGIVVFNKSVDWPVSLLGVSVMSFALGLMIGPAVATYAAVTVMQAIVLTLMVMVGMSIVGILFPQIFEGTGPFLMAALLVLIAASFAQIILVSIGFEQALNMPLLAWAGVGVFSLFVAYDWSRALGLPHTMDNAVDVSGALILDGVNLFLRLLQILSGVKIKD